MDRLLFSTVDNGNYNAGHVVGYVIGLIYMLAFVYYIYRKYLNILFEDLLGILEKDHDDYFYKPIVFSLLNSIQFLILCFFSAFISKSNLGVATVIGSDAFSLLFVIPVIIMRFKDMNHGNQDAWTLLRDMTLYVGCLIMILFFIYFNVPEIISSILLLVYYLINLFVLSQNQEIKEKLMEWLNLNNEDNEFNSDEHFTYKKRRNSLSQLIQQNCIDYEDKNLIKRLNRVEVQLTLQYKDAQDLPKKKRAQVFQRAVYVIVFAIRKNSQNERIQRTQYYQNLYKPKNARVNIPPLNTQMHNIVKEKPQQDNLMVQNPNDDREEQPFNSNPMDSVKNNEQEPNTQGQENINLNMPDNILDKILFIIFYPIHLILYLLPNYINEVGPKKLVLCLFSNICLLVGCSFCIDWWTYEFSMATTIPIQIMGLVVIGSAIQIQFYQYQMEVARKVQSPEFVSCFTQTALCKISFCVGLPWLFTVLGEFNIDPSNITKYSQAFAISIAVYVGLLFLFVLQCFLRRFKILQEDGVIMLCYYFGFLLTSIIIISLNILS